MTDVYLNRGAGWVYNQVDKYFFDLGKEENKRNIEKGHEFSFNKVKKFGQKRRHFDSIIIKNIESCYTRNSF